MVLIRQLRSLTLFACFVLFLGVGAATDIEIRSEPVNETVAPGENATVATYDLGVRNGAVNLTDVSVTRIPFETVVDPSHVTLDGSCPEANRDIDGNCPWANQTITLNVSVPRGEIPDTYEGEIAFRFAEHESIEDTVTVEVPEVVDWTLIDYQFNDSVNIGSDGVLGAFTLENRGNVRTSVDVNLTGNLSEYLVVDDVVDLRVRRTPSLLVDYRVRSDTPFGTYNGTLTLRGEENRSDAVNLSVEFVDEQLPEIQDVAVPDEVMATLEADWSILARDNLEVAAVTAAVVRETTVTEGNTTRTVNASVANVSFEAVEHTDTWEATFTDTGERGQYYATITVEDSAGNAVNRTAAFTVTDLDALQVLESNFVFDGDRPDADLARPVFELEVETPVDVELVSFRELDSNESVVVGIREVDDASPETIEPGESVQVAEPGTYELVVAADEPGRFRGELAYGVVDQHVNVSTTVFSGEFIDPECPPEDERESGDYHFEYRYTDSDCLDGDIQYIVTAPGENCLGYADPADCVNVEGGDLGRIDALEARADRYWKWLWGIGIIAVILVITTSVAALYFLKLYPGDYRVRIKDTD